MDSDKHSDDAYRRQYESVMGDTDIDGDDAGAAASSSQHLSYTERMLDVLGSDGEDEDVQGYAIEPQLPVSSDDGPSSQLRTTNGSSAAPDLEDQADATSIDDEVAVTRTNGGDASTATEDLSVSSSVMSLKPLRPWQFPAPRRLRMLRADDSASNYSFDSPGLPMSPSVMSNSDDGTRSPLALLPYGAEPAASGTTTAMTLLLNGKAVENESDKPDITSRSFLRVSRLCLLSDKEGSPTVMAVASGVIAVGTLQGKVALFDRSRGWTGAIAVEGSISALAISSDKASLAIGTSNGHIYLYDMQRLHAPSRHVPPVTAQAVTSGRSEGHLQHSRILHVAFVGTRHTAIVSADDHGLSFYHSLGKIFGVSSNDTLRILGRYPDAFAEGSNPRKSTVLAMSTLPLGPQQHQSDANSFVALLTPSKLVLVGLKPAARTWYRRLSPDRHTTDSPICGCLAWLACCTVPTPSSATNSVGLVLPALAFSFGRYLYLVRLHAPGGGQEVVVREWKSWTHDEPIEALQWLSHESIALYAKRSMKLYDVRRGCCTEEQSFLRPAAQRWIPERIGGRATVPSLGGAVKSHKGQLFVLTPKELIVAVLISWADRLLVHVSQGDSLGAIEQATEYLRNPQSGGSRIGLPELFDEQKPLIASRLVELMRASTAYAFSEERMKDDMAHYPQGVDRTPLFQGLARVCAEACLALNDFQFLFDELYDAYSDAGIESVFADQMEQFIVQGLIRTLPIPVVQRLVAFRKRQERYDLAERIIRNVDPASLDLDQAISLCLEHQLFDALFYVYISALHDFVSPIVEMLPLVKRQEGEAYRVFSYLSVVLLGRTYPNQTALEDEEAHTARTTVYRFLFSGRCVIWPPQGQGGGQLITTLDKELDEPTYPYLRLFLDFDAEALLDALDVALEDAWLDEDNDWSRQRIVSTLYDLDNVSDDARVFVAIFIARNAPKYPQFVRLSATQVDRLMHVLSSAATDDDDTQADRQYAVECLLSAYKPAHTAELLASFERAGFNDILRRVYRSEGKWDKLTEMIVAQTEILDEKTFDELDDVLRRSRNNARVQTTVLHALPSLVDVDADKCAALIQRRLPEHLHEAIHVLDRSPHRQLTLLSVFVNGDGSLAQKLSLAIRSQYVALLSSLEPQSVIKALDKHDRGYFDLAYVIEVTTDEDVLDALLWAYDRSDKTEQGFKMMSDAFAERAMILRSSSNGGDASSSPSQQEVDDEHIARDQIQQLTDMAVRICTERAQEALWVTLLQQLIRFTHEVQSSNAAVVFARGVLQDALSSFVSSTSADDVSFAGLFRRLAPEQKDSTYAEVRDIADAMMGAYKVRQELLGITNRLFGRDVFTAMQRLTRQRRRGWRPISSGVQCPGCGRACLGDVERGFGGGGADNVVDGERGELGRRSMSTSVSLSDMQPTSASSPLMRRQSSEPTTAVGSARPDKGKRVMRGESSNDGTVSTSQDDVEEGVDGSHSIWRNSGEVSAEDDYFRSATSPSATSRNMSDPTETFLATPSLGSYDVTLPVQYTDDETAAQSTNQEQALPTLEGVVVCFSGEVWHRQCAPAHLLQQQQAHDYNSEGTAAA